MSALMISALLTQYVICTEPVEMTIIYKVMFAHNHADCVYLTVYQEHS
jgi:hypothetical protein